MNPIHLLIVHPVATASTLVAAVLRASGFEAVEAGDAEGAARELAAGVALLLAAPAALGPLARTLREHPEVPVVLLVEGPDAGWACDARRLGAAGVLRLPAPAAVLRATVVQALGLDAIPQADAPRPGPAGGPARACGEKIGPDRCPVAGPAAGIGGVAGAGPMAAPAPRRPSPGPVDPPKQRSPRLLKLKEAMQGPERRIIVRTLKALGWNRQETATALGIDRTTLHKKMRRYGLLKGGTAPGSAGPPTLRAHGSPRCEAR